MLYFHDDRFWLEATIKCYSKVGDNCYVEKGEKTFYFGLDGENARLFGNNNLSRLTESVFFFIRNGHIDHIEYRNENYDVYFQRIWANNDSTELSVRDYEHQLQFSLTTGKLVDIEHYHASFTGVIEFKPDGTFDILKQHIENNDWDAACGFITYEKHKTNYSTDEYFGIYIRSDKTGTSLTRSLFDGGTTATSFNKFTVKNYGYSNFKHIITGKIEFIIKNGVLKKVWGRNVNINVATNGCDVAFHCCGDNWYNLETGEREDIAGWCTNFNKKLVYFVEEETDGFSRKKLV